MDSSADTRTRAKIRVIARLRPRLPGEPPDSSLQVVHVDGRPCVEISNLKNTTTGSFQFQFTNAHPGTATQENIFEQDILPMLEYVYSGIVRGESLPKIGRSRLMSMSRP
ncbi:hypothetical protein FISHEDRAFT_73723 [Fistulina hepatica ATCC 64428]|uniref:Kinesin motor domain-containing protein n=1 Tax=Fistulina hepatica ATCC 64428 TaxID=1128425 RepID=A0A0D7AC06_9AGAR|nr:hypothetical protein FISHEDRAFT_73723 [Fistulina hepatica ATCC 64428]